MANSILLNEYLKDSGKTKTFLASKMDVSRPKLDKLFSNPQTATFTQAEQLSDELSISKADMHTIFC